MCAKCGGSETTCDCQMPIWYTYDSSLFPNQPKTDWFANAKCSRCGLKFGTCNCKNVIGCGWVLPESN